MIRSAKFLSTAVVGALFAGGSARAGDFQPVPVVVPAPGVTFAQPGWPGHCPPVRNYDYAVYVRAPGHRHWRYYGTYETRRQAERAEHHLRHHGYHAEVFAVADRPHFPNW